MAHLDDNKALLIYRVGPVLCCAPTLPVEAIIPPPRLTHPPGVSQGQPGIFKHGPNLVQVIDLRVQFGVREANWTQPGQIVIATIAERHYGFHVDQIIDVIQFPGQGWGQLPASLSGGVFTRSLKLDTGRSEKLHLYAEFEKLQNLKQTGFLRAYIEQLEAEQKLQHPPDSTINETTSSSHASLKKESPQISDPSQHAGEQIPVESRPAESRTQIKHAEPVNRTTDVSIASASKRSRHAAARDADHGRPSPQATVEAATHTAPHTKPAPMPHIKEPSAVKIKPAATEIQFPIPTSDSAKEHSLTPPPAPINANKDHHGFFGLFLLILLLIGLGGGGYILLQPAEETLTSPPRKVSSLSSTVSRPAPPPVVEPVSTVALVEPESTPMNPPAEVDEKDSAYHARIESRENELTIVLHTPENEDAFIDKPMETVNQVITEPPSHEARAAVQMTSLDLKPRTLQREVVHVVVKGDTLWHITQRYVHNPYRYPELARLNKIPNPDLIYPGQKVRIIQVFGKADTNE